MKSAYSTQEAANLLKLPGYRVRVYARAAGIGSRPRVGPGEGPGRWHFTFPDLVVLRMARRLEQQGAPPARIERALVALRNRAAPAEVHLTSAGEAIVARRESVSWEPESGQVLFGFTSAGDADGTVVATFDVVEEVPTSADTRPSDYPPPLLLGDVGTAHGWFELAASMEEKAPQRAYEAYLRVLACDPEHVEAMINIGRLCSAAGERERAAAYFRQAIRVEPTQPVAHFNLGVTLHDLGDIHGAIVSYRSALIHDSGFADAHYNLASLLEETGDVKGAARHMSAYRVACRDGD